MVPSEWALLHRLRYPPNVTRVQSGRAVSLLLGGAFVLLTACGGTGVREVRSAGGDKVYEAKCKSSAAECIADARSTCSEGYEVLDSESHAGGVLADAIPGPVTWYAMTFKCNGFASGSPPEFPFRGQQYEPTPSRPIFEPTPSAAHGRECSDDITCGVGYVCSKPVGSFNGECAKAVDGMGNQVFTGPRSNSFGPGKRQCNFATDCGIGFECDEGRCIKR